MRTIIKTKAILLPALTLVMLLFCGCDNYVGVEWVVDYKAVGKWDLPDRKACAEGFYQTLLTHPDWKGEFNVGNANAWEKHFKRGSKGGVDSDWIDAVNFAYFAGHGAGAGNKPTGVGKGGGFTFGVDKNDDWVLSSVLFNCEPSWGDKTLDWIVLDVCSALATNEDGNGYPLHKRWANSQVMHGLHLILGFGTSATDQADRGKFFAEYLLGIRGGKKHTIREAWMKATKDTESLLYDTDVVKGACLSAFNSDRHTFDDYIYGCGPVCKDPDPSSQVYFLFAWPCN